MDSWSRGQRSTTVMSSQRGRHPVNCALPHLNLHRGVVVVSGPAIPASAAPQSPPRPLGFSPRFPISPPPPPINSSPRPPLLISPLLSFCSGARLVQAPPPPTFMAHNTNASAPAQRGGVDPSTIAHFGEGGGPANPTMDSQALVVYDPTIAARNRESALQGRGPVTHPTMAAYNAQGAVQGRGQFMADPGMGAYAGGRGAHMNPSNATRQITASAYHRGSNYRGLTILPVGRTALVPARPEGLDGVNRGHQVTCYAHSQQAMIPFARRYTPISVVGAAGLAGTSTNFVLPPPTTLEGLGALALPRMWRPAGTSVPLPWSAFERQNAVAANFSMPPVTTLASLGAVRAGPSEEHLTGVRARSNKRMAPPTTGRDSKRQWAPPNSEEIDLELRLWWQQQDGADTVAVPDAGDKLALVPYHEQALVPYREQNIVDVSKEICTGEHQGMGTSEQNIVDVSTEICTGEHQGMGTSSAPEDTAMIMSCAENKTGNDEE